MIKALDCRFYVKFMQLEIGLLGIFLTEKIEMFELIFNTFIHMFGLPSYTLKKVALLLNNGVWETLAFQSA